MISFDQSAASSDLIEDQVAQFELIILTDFDVEKMVATVFQIPSLTEISWCIYFRNELHAHIFYARRVTALQNN